MTLIVPEQERALFDSLAVEHLNLSVGKVVFYSLNKETTNIDPLYQEPEEIWNFTEYEVTAYVSKPEHTVSPTEPGRVIERVGLFVIARKEIEEKKIPFPKIGDVVKFWGLYFDIVKASPVGFVSDTDYYTHWRCELVRRTRYVPEIKVETIA